MSESQGDNKSIEIVGRLDENLSRGDRTTMVSNSVNVGVLRSKFKDFMDGLQSLIEIDAGAPKSPFRLNEIQFTAEITANGEFKLLGAGVGVEASGGVTFVLQRQQSPGSGDKA